MIVKTRKDLMEILYWLQEEAELPIEVTAKPYKTNRSLAQNRLAFGFYKAAADQLGDDSADGYRALCKLTIGVGILKEENEDFARQYDEVVKPLSYEQKLKIMLPPIEFPVTSLLKIKGMAKYLDAVEVYLSGLGVDLPKDDEYNLAMGRKK